jgi:DNA-binding NarL/FixJ family response regulator
MNIPLILDKNYSGFEYLIIGNDYEGLEWLDESTKPTEEELKAQWADVQAKLEADSQAKIDARSSALAKLAALGLTEEEIAAL